MQLFLIGAYHFQTKSAEFVELQKYDFNEGFYNMKSSENNDSEELDMLSEDQMPIPEYSDNDTEEQASVTENKQTYELKNNNQNNVTKTVKAEPLGKTSKATNTEASATIFINDINFRNEDGYDIAEFIISAPVKIMKKNQGGHLLKVRITPTVHLKNNSLMKELNKRFDKASIYKTNHYTEFLFSSEGRIGSPYTASGTKDLFNLCIPYKSQKGRFCLKNGQYVAEGLTYYKDRTQVGSNYADVHILRIEPLSDKIQILPTLANEGIAQRESLSSMAKRYNAVAGINGSYFTSRGDPIGTLIINRKLISSPLYKRSVFGITDNGTMIFGNPDFSGTLKSDRISEKIDAVNQPRYGNSLVVFTPEYSRSTLTHEDGLELVLVKGKIVGIHTKDALIPPDGVVISAGGIKAERLKRLKLGMSVELDYSIDQPWNTIKHALCGGPRIMANGKIDINGKEEKFSNSIINGRHPRTAVALTMEGDLLLIVVDGRSKTSVGMKLSELGTYLKKIGVIHAINLDGGGSTAMYLNGKIINKPSDGGERRISNGILVTKR